MDPSSKSQVLAYSIPAPHQIFTDMSISQLRAFKRSSSTIFRSLETVSNRLNGELSVGIPLDSECRCTGEGITSYKT